MMGVEALPSIAGRGLEDMRNIITWSTRGRHPWIVIAIWVLVAGGLATGPKLQSVTSNDASKSLPASLESKRADALQQASFADAKGTPIIVVYSSEAQLTEADKAAIAEGEAWLTGGAEPINSARVEYSPDGKGALIFASLAGNPGDEAFRDSVQAIGDHFGDSVNTMQVRVTGPGGLITDVYRIFLNADVKLLLGTVMLVLILLLVIYRSPVLPFVPLLAVGFGYFVAGGILAQIATALDVTLSGQATSLMVILLFGAGTDYGLLLISRYREELRRESDARVALSTALGETWEAIAASGLTVTLAVLALLFANYGDYTSFAPVLGLGVFVTLIAGLTLMPALLALLGRRAFWPRRPKLGDPTEHRTWQRIAERVAAAPKRAAGLVTVILVVLALGCLFYSPRFSFTEDFLKDMPSKQGYALLEKHFPKGSLAPTTVLIQAPQAPPEYVTGMLVGALNKSPGVAAAFPTGTADDGKLLSFQVILEGDPYSKEALQQVRRLRETARKAAAAGQATALVGGPTAIQADTWALSNRDTLVVAVIALVVVGVILAALLRALVAPLYLLATNLLSYLAALGGTILITEKILGWERISYRIPLYMFIFLVALGSDYNIFITTRIRGEAMLCGLRDGTVKALAATGGVLTSAGIILAGTFLILLSQPVKDLAEISIGVALGVLLDTFLVRTALVPGLTLAIGPKAGWPGPRWTRSAATTLDAVDATVPGDPAASTT
ncbi:MAG: MMPL family transporter [Actinobacteria bacterium]|nr:MMPL family transporter [Actinomycetota bacterium]